MAANNGGLDSRTEQTATIYDLSKPAAVLFSVFIESRNGRSLRAPRIRECGSIGSSIYLLFYSLRIFGFRRVQHFDGCRHTV